MVGPLRADFGGRRGRKFGACAYPQVVADWSGEYFQRKAEGDAQGAASMAKQWERSAADFLQGKKRHKNSEEGAPLRKKHRAAAAALGRALDNALTCGTGHGLSHFQVPAEADQRGDPFLWPRLCIAPDQASDGVSLFHYMAYNPGMRINCQVSWDFSHGTWNDWRGAVKSCGCWGWFLVSLVSFNAFHGPWGEARFFQEMVGASTEYLQMSKHELSEDPLLAAFLPDLLRDTGDEHRIGEEGLSATIMEERNRGPGSGPKPFAA